MSKYLFRVSPRSKLKSWPSVQLKSKQKVRYPVCETHLRRITNSEGTTRTISNAIHVVKTSLADFEIVEEEVELKAVRRTKCRGAQQPASVP